MHNNIVINISTPTETSPWQRDWERLTVSFARCENSSRLSNIQRQQAETSITSTLEKSGIKRSLEDVSLTLCNNSREQKSSFSYLLADFISITVCQGSRYLSFAPSPLQFWICWDSKMPLRCVAPCLLTAGLCWTLRYTVNQNSRLYSPVGDLVMFFQCFYLMT